MIIDIRIKLVVHSIEIVMPEAWNLNYNGSSTNYKYNDGGNDSGI